MPDETSASAWALMVAASIWPAKVFHEAQPIGGGVTATWFVVSAAGSTEPRAEAVSVPGFAGWPRTAVLTRTRLNARPDRAVRHGDRFTLLTPNVGAC